MLKPLPAEPGGRLHPLEGGLVVAVVAALGNNGSELAHATLEQVLTGKFPTSDDKAAVEMVLRGLAAHPGEANYALLFQAITAPEEVRPAQRQGKWPADDLRAKAFDAVKATAPASSARSWPKRWPRDSSSSTGPRSSPNT